MNSIGVGGPASVNLQNIQSLDMDKALLSVQHARASKLEGLIKSGVEDIKAKNEAMHQLLQASASLRSIQSTVNGASRSSEEKLTDVQSAAFRAVQHAVGGSGGIRMPETVVLTFGDLTNAIETMKSRVDAFSDVQQMDLLRLQSMSNKRNEAFDVMTNFVKKMQDSGSPFIGNMR